MKHSNTLSRIYVSTKTFTMNTRKIQYDEILVETFIPSKGDRSIRVRPLPNQEPYSPHLLVECSKKMRTDYPLGTKFWIKAKLKNTSLNTIHIYSNYNWSFTVLLKT